jgi:prepilin-type N-terminal cleavage/methylation domain-containing protein
MPTLLSGFTLVEMAVVVVLMGILLTMGVSTWLASVNSSAIRATKERQVAVREALISYLRTNGRLPCPDIGPSSSVAGPIAAGPDGRENRSALNGGEPDTTADCAQAFGLIPYADLGLSREASLDAWGNAMLYRVSNTHPASPPSSDWVRKLNFRPANIGGFLVSDRVADVPAVAVLISHGRNGLGAWTTRGTQIDATGAGADEAVHIAGCVTGSTPALVCYNRDITESATAAGGAFDDIVLGITANDILTPLIKEGVIKSAAATLNSTFETMIDALASNAGKGLPPTCPYTLSSVTLLDPWGNSMTCNPSTTNLTVAAMTATPNTVICTITSSGPNAAATSDDITRNVTYAELASRLIRNGC